MTRGEKESVQILHKSNLELFLFISILCIIITCSWHVSAYFRSCFRNFSCGGFIGCDVGVRLVETHLI